jgi:ferredoxin
MVDADVTVIIEPERCIGAGMCALTAPEIFAQDDEGFVVLIGAHALDIDPAIKAAGFCPSGALSLRRTPDR